MPISDIYVLDHKQSFNGEPIHNIYTFLRPEDGDALNLINAFEAELLPLVLAIQANQIKTDLLTAYTLQVGGNIDEKTLTEQGALGPTEMLPVFNAVNFTLKPAGRAVRPGGKRYAGVPEAVQIDGEITQTGYLAAMEALRLGLGEGITDGVDDFWQPVIVKRIKYVPDPDKPDHFAYRFPETDAELVYALLRNVVTTPFVRHQVTRGN